ncbi:MAG: YbdK family carboxylate-amine ligase [Solirubrobacteraceae bacterium]
MNTQTLRQAFERVAPLTVGVEEELMLLDAGTLELAPRAGELLRALDGDPRFKRELPAAQIELLTPPVGTVVDATEHLRAARRDLAAAAAPLGLLVAGAGAHPFSAPLGLLNDGGRYDTTKAEFGIVAEAQLIFGLHIHVAVGGADATIAVHDALRTRLPELAALAAAAPFYLGRDSGLASVRPEICGLLPRQGVPPALGSMANFAAELAWAAAAGIPDPRRWWWELRPHPVFGTLEVRVCDAQPDALSAGALAGVVHALVADLCERHAVGELEPPVACWRIAENRWSACRHGLAGEMADPHTGRREPTADRVAVMLEGLRDAARRVGADKALEDARVMLATGGGAARQREIGAQQGAHGLTAWLAKRFLPAGLVTGRS